MSKAKKSQQATSSRGFWGRRRKFEADRSEVGGRPRRRPQNCFEFSDRWRRNRGGLVQV